PLPGRAWRLGDASQSALPLETDALGQDVRLPGSIGVSNFLQDLLLGLAAALDRFSDLAGGDILGIGDWCGRAGWSKPAELVSERLRRPFHRVDNRRRCSSDTGTEHSADTSANGALL